MVVLLSVVSVYAFDDDALKISRWYLTVQLQNTITFEVEPLDTISKFSGHHRMVDRADKFENSYSGGRVVILHLCCYNVFFIFVFFFVFGHMRQF